MQLNSLQKQLKKLNIQKSKMDNGKTVEKTMKKEAEMLKEIIQHHLKMYLKTHPSKQYIRTGELENSLEVNKIIDISADGTTLTVRLKFGDKAIHPSGYGLGWEGSGSVNTAYALDMGYQVKKNVWFRDIENFGFREPGNFIENAIDEYNFRSENFRAVFDYRSN